MDFQLVASYKPKGNLWGDGEGTHSGLGREVEVRFWASGSIRANLDCAAHSSTLHAECTFAFRLGLFRARYQRMNITPAPLGKI
jgi:hypothetical protein